MKRHRQSLALLLVLLAVYYMHHLSASPAYASDALTSEKLNEEGKRCFAVRQYDEAANAWLEQLQYNPGNLNIYNNIGMAYRMLGDFERSAKYHIHAIGMRPSFGHSHYSLGQTYFEAKAYDKALKEFQIAFDLKFAQPSCYYYFGRIYKEFNDCPKALEAYRKSIELDPRFEKDTQKYIALCGG